jgi:hypothetical protein
MAFSTGLQSSLLVLALNMSAVEENTTVTNWLF